jgi:hypothetical protein
MGARTVGAVHGGVEEEDGLVDDAAAGAARADQAAHNARGAAGHEGDHAVGGAAAALDGQHALGVRHGGACNAPKP